MVCNWVFWVDLLRVVFADLAGLSDSVPWDSVSTLLVSNMNVENDGPLLEVFKVSKVLQVALPSSEMVGELIEEGDHALGLTDDTSGLSLIH